MNQNETTIWTQPNIQVTTPVRYCSECKYQQFGANVEPCHECLKDTTGSKWEPK